MTAGKRLRELLAGRDVVVAPGVFDGISAALVGRIGFAAAYLTGAGIAASGFGLPDIGLVTQTEMAERARMVVQTLGDIPLIADADTGYGAPLNVIRTVHEFEAAGVAAVQLEDQAFPKRCGHLPGKELVSERTFLASLRAALEARTDPDLVVIARTDSRAQLGLDAAIDRANACAAAGADVIFVEAPRSAEEIERIAAEINTPLLINVVQGGLTPDIPAERLAELGFRIAIHPGVALVPAAMTMQGALRALSGKPATPTSGAGPAEFFRLVGLDDWSELGERYRTDGREEPA